MGELYLARTVKGNVRGLHGSFADGELSATGESVLMSAVKIGD